MRLIYTAELERVDPFDYLVQRQATHHKPSPARMPWNYRGTLAVLGARSRPSSLTPRRSGHAHISDPHADR